MYQILHLMVKNTTEKFSDVGCKNGLHHCGQISIIQTKTKEKI